MMRKLLHRLRTWLNSETVRDFARGVCLGFMITL